MTTTANEACAHTDDNHEQQVWQVLLPGQPGQPLDYLAPRDSHLVLGMRVLVPIGSSRRVGVLWSCHAASMARLRLKTIIAVLDTEPVLPADLLRLLAWSSDHYHTPPGQALAAALPAAIRRLPTSRRQDNPIGAAPAVTASPACAWPLTADQQQALAAIISAMGQRAVLLLHGVTGSGKTEVFLHAIAHAASQGLQTLLMTPEIGLTPQLSASCSARLPGLSVATVHSGMTERERLAARRAAATGEACVVVGTRSAVFLPFARLGLIICDEEHDTSYKQSESWRYNGRDLAIVRSRLLHIPVVLASATPSLESMRWALAGHYQHLIMQQRPVNRQGATIQCIDCRHQKLEAGMSPTLLEAIAQQLQWGGQVLLFQNRRGYAPMVRCTDCGAILGCHQCDARLILHTQPGQPFLLCHHCGLQRLLPALCPACGTPALQPMGTGTQRLEAALQERFAGVRIARIDRDSMRRKGHLGQTLQAVRTGEVQIVVGTQMIAKGHDFPGVTLAAVMDADEGLLSPDFRAADRMAQLITQVAGRAGRGERPGLVIIQTHQPRHVVLRTLLDQGYDGYVRMTLLQRRTTHWPPYWRLALLHAEARHEDTPLQTLQQLAEQGRNLLAGQSGVQVLGPMPATMVKRRGLYRAQLLVRASTARMLHAFLRGFLPKKMTQKGVRLILDVDPMDLL